MTSAKHIANRVTQLESRQLDSELNDMVDSIVEQLEIPYFNEELKTILKLYLCTYSIQKNQTVGMQVYSTNFCYTNKYNEGITFTIPSKHKVAMLAALNIIGPYTVKRSGMIEKLMQKFGGLNAPWVNFDNAILILKSLKILNFLAFLKGGKYLTISERILGIVPVLSNEDYYRNVQLNRIQMDYMYRELIWKVFAEFLTTVLPMINVELIKNRVSRFTGLVPKLQSEMNLSEKIERESNSKRCAVCLKQPFNPYVIGCRHVFCYYCVQSKYLADPSNGYVCLLCNYNTNDQADLQRYKFTGQLQ